MRFTKNEILEYFKRQERSYRLSLLSTHWLRGVREFKPSAIEEANGFRIRIGSDWILFTDLAQMLQDDHSMIIITTDFMLNQLHALIRGPFELLKDYCEDFDELYKNEKSLFVRMKQTDWYEFTRIIRNAISHNFRYEFSKRDKDLLPITWNGISITERMDSEPMEYQFWHKPGYKLFLEMQSFAQGLPES